MHQFDRVLFRTELMQSWQQIFLAAKPLSIESARPAKLRESKPICHRLDAVAGVPLTVLDCFHKDRVPVRLMLERPCNSKVLFFAIPGAHAREIGDLRRKRRLRAV
ncbi:hypothetical protein [Paraburkholderia sediminicola]|uniref:hypothetical protein n=1 Tax=Paraburkholderia sediminicola TaxID=458836 RepID=UPI0038B70DFC